MGPGLRERLLRAGSSSKSQEKQFLKKSKGAWTTASTSSSVLEKNRSSAVLADNSAALSLMFQQVVAGGPWGFGWKKRGWERRLDCPGKEHRPGFLSLLSKLEHFQE